MLAVLFAVCDSEFCAGATTEGMLNDAIMCTLLQVDRLFDWKSEKDAPIRQSLERQKPHVRAEFEQKFKQSRLNLNEQGLNVALFWENPDVRRYVNIVPTSAISGEGIPDMLQLLVELTQVSCCRLEMA